MSERPREITLSPALLRVPGWRGPAAVLLVLLALGMLAAALIGGQSLFLSLLPPAQVYGTLTMFVLLPPYLLAMTGFMFRHTEAALGDLAPVASPEAIGAVHHRLAHFRTGDFVWVAVGCVFGLAQNDFVVSLVARGEDGAFLDYVFILGNVIVWGCVTFLLAWRVRVSRSLTVLGEQVDVDLHHPERLRPFGRIATADILVVFGGVAFMPLQSLDAQLRIVNYSYGFAVAAVAGTLLFLLPLLGVHRRVRAVRAARVEELVERIDALPGDDLQRLELSLAHLDRIRAVPTWPLDLRLVGRIFVYVIIPPLAWIAAALVEMGIERL